MISMHTNTLFPGYKRLTSLSVLTDFKACSEKKKKKKTIFISTFYALGAIHGVAAAFSMHG